LSSPLKRGAKKWGIALSSPLKRGAKKWGIAFSGSPSETQTNGPGRSIEEKMTNPSGFKFSRVMEAKRHG